MYGNPKQLAAFNTFVHGTPDVTHRYGIGACDASGRPLDTPFSLSSSYTLDSEILGYEALSQGYKLKLENDKFLVVKDLPKVGIEKLVGMGINLGSAFVDRDEKSVSTYHTNYSSLKSGLMIILGRVKIDTRTGKFIDEI